MLSQERVCIYLKYTCYEVFICVLSYVQSSVSSRQCLCIIGAHCVDPTGIPNANLIKINVPMNLQNQCILNKCKKCC